MFKEQKGAQQRHTYRCFDTAYCCADISHQHDLCRLKQTNTPKGAAQKCLTTFTDVMILNYTVGLDVARETQSNTQGPIQHPGRVVL